MNDEKRRDFEIAEHMKELDKMIDDGISRNRYCTKCGKNLTKREIKLELIKCLPCEVAEVKIK